MMTLCDLAGTCYVWRMMRGASLTTHFEPLHKLRAHPNAFILKCLLSPDVRQLATASSDKTVKLWNLDGFTLDRTLTGASSLPLRVPQVCMQIHHTQGKNAAVWRGGGGAAEGDGFCCGGAGHQRWVWDCVFSVDAAYLVTASSDCSARLWDLSSGDAIRMYSGHHKACVCCALNDSAFEGRED